MRIQLPLPPPGEPAHANDSTPPVGKRTLVMLIKEHWPSAVSVGGAVVAVLGFVYAQGYASAGRATKTDISAAVSAHETGGHSSFANITERLSVLEEQRKEDKEQRVRLEKKVDAILIRFSIPVPE